MDYSFTGSHNGIIWSINRLGTSGVANIEAYELDNPQKPLKVEQDQDGSTVELRIHHRVQDEQSSFLLRYELETAVFSYEDIADLHWYVIDLQNQISFETFEMTLVMPQPFLHEEVEVFPRMPENAHVNVQDDKIVMSAAPLAKHKEAGIRVLFPNDFVPENQKTRSKSAKEEIIMKEEDGLFAYWTRFLFSENPDLQVLEMFLIIIIIPGALIYILYYYTKEHYYGHYPEPYRGGTYPHIPKDIAPAVAGLFVNGSFSESMVMATLMDFVRKGYVHVKKEQDEADDSTQHKKNEKSISFYPVHEHPPIEQLSVQEQFLFYWLFADVAHEGLHDVEILKQYAENHPEKFEEKWDKWRELVKDELDKLAYKQNNPGALWFLVTGLVTVISGITLMAIFQVVQVIALLLLGIGIACHALFYFGKTEEGQTQMIKWKGYIEYLKDIHRYKDSLDSDEQSWERHIIYAVTFGISDQVIQELKGSFPQLLEQHPHLFVCQSSYLIMFTASFEQSLHSTSSTSFGAGRGGGGAGGSF